MVRVINRCFISSWPIPAAQATSSRDKLWIDGEIVIPCSPWVNLSICCLQKGRTSQALSSPGTDIPQGVRPAQMQRIAAGKDIDSRSPKCFASAQTPDLLCSTQETSAGQGGGGKVGKKLIIMQLAKRILQTFRRWHTIPHCSLQCTPHFGSLLHWCEQSSLHRKLNMPGNPSAIVVITGWYT